MPADYNSSPDFLQIFEKALNSFRQKSRRAILSSLFEKHTKSNVLSKVIAERSTFAKNVLSW